MSDQGLALRQEIFNEVTVIMNQPDFKRYGEEVGKLVADCRKIKVINSVTEERAVEKISKIKGLLKRLDEARKGNATLLRYRGVVDAVNNTVHKWTDPLTDAEKYLKEEMKRYDAQVEMQRRKEQEIAQKKSEKLKAKIEKEAEKLGIDAPDIPEPVVPKRSGTIRGAGGGKVSTRKVWKAKLVDMRELALAVGKGKVPKGLLVFNQGLANTLAAKGERDIPGVEIYQETEFSGYAA